MEIVKSLLSQKSQFDLVEKIKNKNRTRASLFQFSEDGHREIFLSGLGGMYTPIDLYPIKALMIDFVANTTYMCVA